MPSFISEPKNVRAVIGDKVKFKLKFSGNPQPGNLFDIFAYNNEALLIQLIS